MHCKPMAMSNKTLLYRIRTFVRNCERLCCECVLSLSYSNDVFRWCFGVDMRSRLFVGSLVSISS